ncbi:uncharacterized protein BDZ99DRAFT_80287 [Mytilinidion resinicola]|uniref:Uncharacterized protein n=1 Tax=Mytilinidion resinicola TaxID=574789 RepID=A0A6A6YFT6_9PEZI|nr:uncharacterized protein BDZ99DRAFT_80287 [Mytilinidion resinicola]KAF2807459.1 hypothetical protein BDZ99DRAFT_80287 [Mytilinidion resinicola]
MYMATEEALCCYSSRFHLVLCIRVSAIGFIDFGRFVPALLLLLQIWIKRHS